MKPFKFISDNDLRDYKSIQMKFPYKRGISLQAHISDIHFGVMDAKIEYQILKEQFIDRIKDLPLDIISIDGDLFDRLSMSNTDAVLYANIFISDIVNICKQNMKLGIHTTLILIAGTKNHDAGQLQLYYHYLNDPNIDIRIVEQIQFEYVNGAKILCIPELYGIKEEEYSKFFWNFGEYDMCFMHGTIDGSVYNNNSGESRVFKPSDFGYCNGPVISGHIHPGGCFHSFMYYNGSPIRWNFGEEGPKGFQIVLYDLDTRYYYIYLEQIHSFRYDTISIDDLLLSDPKDIIKYIDQLKIKENIDYLRLKCSISENSQDIIKILQEYYKNDKTIKFKLDRISNSNNKTFESSNEIYEKYKYIFDKSKDPYDILAKFISDNEMDILISGKDIKKLILEQ